MPALVVTRDGKQSRLFRWDEGSIGIGRHESNDLFLSDKTVSRWHAALFEREDGGWRLRDLGSRDGVWLAGAKTTMYDLDDGDVFGIGPYRVQFRGVPGDAAVIALAEADEADPLPPDVQSAPLEPPSDESAPLWEVVDKIAAGDGLDARFESLVAAIAARTKPSLVLAGRTGPGHAILVRAQRADAAGHVDPESVRPSRSLLREALHEGRALVWRDARADGSVGALGILSAVATPVELGSGEHGIVYADWRAAAGQPTDADLEWVAALVLASRGALRSSSDAERVERERLRLLRSRRARTQFAGISGAVRDLLRDVDRCAVVERDVLLLGESGTGKELLARRVHERSPRCAGPFVVVDVNTVPADLFESELFGHVKGAFTGATRDREGKVAAAAGGTLFIDEIGDLPAGLQGKLLRLLQEREYTRVGEDRPRMAAVRIVAATHRDLDDMRLDLKMRLTQGVVVKTPPLRERPEDITFLSYFFLDQLAAELDRDVKSFKPEVMEAFFKYGWPGNVRELRALIGNAVVFAGGPIRLRDFRYAGEIFGLHADTLPDLAEVEREHIIRVLHATRGNQRRAAEILGINPNTLKDKMTRHGLDRGDFRTRT